jgi:ASC-1-like (ASCH) protein
MVKPYNASIESRTNYLKDKFEKKIQDGKEIFINEDNLIFNSYDLTVYSTIIDKVISNEFPKLTEFNKYLNNIANICSKLKIPII